MKNKSKPFIALTLIFLFAGGIGELAGQALKMNLYRSTSIMWQNTLHICGLRTHGDKLMLCVYKLDKGPVLSDSLICDFGRGKPENHNRLWMDTLHGFLNIYIQQQGGKSVDIARINGRFEMQEHVKQIETARLNNTAMLGHQPFYSGESAYSIRTVSDTAGKQFFLNRYKLLRDSGNFDYKLEWQFAFDRKNISNARVIHAGDRTVNLFTVLDQGKKAGQWILTINSENGQLIRGSKLNVKGDASVYQPGVCLADTMNKKMFLAGEVTPPARSEKAHHVYFIEIDSVGRVANRQRFSLPVTEPKRGAAKKHPSFSLVFENLRKNSTGMVAETDIYMQEPGRSCHNYVNSIALQFHLAGTQVTMDRSEIKSNRAIENWLYLEDKTMANGRTCADSIAGGEIIRHDELAFPVKTRFRHSGAGNTWLLQKTETRKGRISFAKTGAEKTIFKVFDLQNKRKSQNPQLHTISAAEYILVSENTAGELNLEQGNW